MVELRQTRCIWSVMIRVFFPWDFKSLFSWYFAGSISESAVVKGRLACFTPVWSAWNNNSTRGCSLRWIDAEGRWKKTGGGRYGQTDAWTVETAALPWGTKKKTSCLCAALSNPFTWAPRNWWLNMIDGCLCRAFWDHTTYGDSKKITWKSFILSHESNHQALVDAFVPLVLESQTRLAPMSLCPLENAFGQVPHFQESPPGFLYCSGTSVSLPSFTTITGKGGNQRHVCQLHNFFLCFFFGEQFWDCESLWIYDPRFSFSSWFGFKNNVSMIFNAWRLANSTKGTRTAFWSMNLKKHIMKCAQSR